MALEDITAGSTIADLIDTNPAGGDNPATVDDHLRAIKLAIKQTFPNISATASGVASEFAFAHKGGTVSGNAVILGELYARDRISVSGTANFKMDVSVSGNLTVSGAIDGSVSGVNGIRPYVATMQTTGILDYNPHGLSSTKCATGLYVITHNFGTANYCMQLTMKYENPSAPEKIPMCAIRSFGTNTIKFKSARADAEISGLVDAVFHVTLWRNS